GEPETGE
nr:Chain P, Nrf2 cyclic peptide,c[GEPETGE] [synthetic construct]